MMMHDAGIEAKEAAVREVAKLLPLPDSLASINTIRSDYALRQQVSFSLLLIFVFLFLFDPVLDLFLPLFWSWIDSAILVAKRCRVLWSLNLQFVVHYTTTQTLIRFLLHIPDYVHVEYENGICSYQA